MIILSRKTELSDKWAWHVNFNEISASYSSSTYLWCIFFTLSTTKMVPRSDREFPTAGIKFAALVSSGLHQTLVTLFRYVVIISYAVKDSPPEFLKCCANDTHSLQPVCNCATSLGSPWAFAYLLLLKESFIICLSHSYSKIYGKLAVRVCKVGQLHFWRESGKQMGLSHTPNALAAFWSTVLG